MMSMANASIVYARIDTGLKEDAEEILFQLGISPSSAIQMLYAQIILKGDALWTSAPLRKASRYGRMTREQFDTELMKGIESMNELQENLYSRRSRCQAETRVWHMSDAYSTYCKKKLTCKWSALTCLRPRSTWSGWSHPRGNTAAGFYAGPLYHYDRCRGKA